MTLRMGFNRVYAVLAAGWFMWAGLYGSLRTAVTFSGFDIVTAPSFWDKPENEQISAIGIAAPPFLQAPPKFQKAYLQRLRKMYQSGAIERTGSRPSNAQPLEWSRVVALPRSFRPWLWSRFWREIGSQRRLVISVALPLVIYWVLVEVAFLLKWPMAFSGVAALISVLSPTRIILLLAITVMIAVTAYPPWIQSFDYEGLHFGPYASAYCWIFSPPGPPQWFWNTELYAKAPATVHLWRSAIDASRLVVEWFGVIAVTGGLLWLCRRREARE